MGQCKTNKEDQNERLQADSSIVRGRSPDAEGICGTLFYADCKLVLGYLWVQVTKSLHSAGTSQKKQKAQPWWLGFLLKNNGADCRTRTRYPMITNQVLYQMS